MSKQGVIRRSRKEWRIVDAADAASPFKMIDASTIEPRRPIIDEAALAHCGVRGTHHCRLRKGLNEMRK